MVHSALIYSCHDRILLPIVAIKFLLTFWSWFSFSERVDFVPCENSPMFPSLTQPSGWMWSQWHHHKPGFVTGCLCKWGEGRDPLDSSSEQAILKYIGAAQEHCGFYSIRDHLEDGASPMHTCSYASRKIWACCYNLSFLPIPSGVEPLIMNSCT